MKKLLLTSLLTLTLLGNSSCDFSRPQKVKDYNANPTYIDGVVTNERFTERNSGAWPSHTFMVKEFSTNKEYRFFSYNNTCDEDATHIDLKLNPNDVVQIRLSYNQSESRSYQQDNFVKNMWPGQVRVTR